MVANDRQRTGLTDKDKLPKGEPKPWKAQYQWSFGCVLVYQFTKILISHHRSDKNSTCIYLCKSLQVNSLVKSIHLHILCNIIIYMVLWFLEDMRTEGHGDTCFAYWWPVYVTWTQGHEDRTGPLLSGNLNGHILSNSNFSLFTLCQWSDIFNDFLQQHNLFHDWFLIKLTLSVTETYSGK